jgi:alcohol dehydrogenase class IV
MKQFNFLRTPKVLFGEGVIEKLGSITCQFGSSALLVHGKHSFVSSGCRDLVFKSLKDKGISFFEYEIPSEPSPQLINGAIDAFGESLLNCVIAIGGGSVLDSGKAISAMLPIRGNVIDFLEIVGSKKTDGKKVPFIAVPTTAGTGSEATSNAVISKIGINGFKCSLRHENFIPDIAIIDPKLALSCPPHITAACGMDALTQLIEAYVSPNASIMTDSLIEKVVPFVKNNLIDAVNQGDRNIDARSAMAYASFISGIVLSNAGLGVVHGIASMLGAAYPVPHGVVCGTLLAPATKVTINKILNAYPGSSRLSKYVNLARMITGSDSIDHVSLCGRLIDELENLTTISGVKTLSEYGVKREHFDFLLNNQNCNKNNPVQLTTSEIAEIMSYRTN